MFDDVVQNNHLIRQFMSFPRNSCAHHNIRTIAGQRISIEKCKQTTYPQNYEYATLLKKNG